MSINDQCIGIWPFAMQYVELAVATIVEMDKRLWFNENGTSIAEPKVT